MPDIARDPAILRRKRIRQAALAAVVVVILAAVSVQLARMEPAAPSVDRATVLEDTVKRGSIIRQVRGVGTLVPEDTRWLPATTEGRVERILLRPGASVHADSVILVLSNPQVEQEALNGRLSLQSARAGLDNLRAQLQNDLLTQEALAASIEADFEQARMEAQANEALAKEQLVSELIRRQSQLKAETLKNRVAIETRRLTAARESIEARLRVQQATVDQAQAIADLYSPACCSRCRWKWASA
jgi:HlyD family secretion protein